MKLLNALLTFITRRTLLHFMLHLAQVSKHGDVNKMRASQLATMVGPSLSWSNSLPYNMDYIVKQNRVFQFIIDNITALRE